jgi:hypothetical protein
MEHSVHIVDIVMKSLDLLPARQILSSGRADKLKLAKYHKAAHNNPLDRLAVALMRSVESSTLSTLSLNELNRHEMSSMHAMVSWDRLHQLVTTGIDEK